MSKTNEYDAAFSSQGYTDSIGDWNSGEYGLTKREYFAAVAMQGMCSEMQNPALQGSPSNVAQEAVRFADALIAELNKE